MLEGILSFIHEKVLDKMKRQYARQLLQQRKQHNLLIVSDESDAEPANTESKVWLTADHGYSWILPGEDIN